MTPHAGKSCMDADAELARLREHLREALAIHTQLREENERLRQPGQFYAYWQNRALSLEHVNAALGKENERLALLFQQLPFSGLSPEERVAHINALESRLAQSEQEGLEWAAKCGQADGEVTDLRVRLAQARALAMQVKSWGDLDPSGPCDCSTCKFLRAREEPK